jgi:hypothetical protein
MKSLGILLSTVLMAVHAGCSGCKKSASEASIEITFDSITENVTCHLFNDTTKPYCNLQITFIYPVGCADTSLLKPIQSIFIAGCFGTGLSDATPEEAVCIYRDRYIENYRQFECDNEGDESSYSFAEHIDEEHSSFSYYEISRNDIFFNQSGILSFSVSSENYTGGAHGAHGFNGYNIDLNTGRLLGESDIFCENCSEEIATAIVQKIAAANGLSDVKELENIGYTDIREIVPNGNFLVNDKGITYIFNEYEIAPYVMGRTEVFLPYNEISLYINKQSLLAKFIF